MGERGARLTLGACSQVWRYSDELRLGAHDILSQPGKWSLRGVLRAFCGVPVATLDWHEQNKDKRHLLPLIWITTMTEISTNEHHDE